MESLQGCPCKAPDPGAFAPESSDAVTERFVILEGKRSEDRPDGEILLLPFPRGQGIAMFFRFPAEKAVNVLPVDVGGPVHQFPVHPAEFMPLFPAATNQEGLPGIPDPKTGGQAKPKVHVAQESIPGIVPESDRLVRLARNQGARGDGTGEILAEKDLLDELPPIHDLFVASQQFRVISSIRVHPRDSGVHEPQVGIPFVQAKHAFQQVGAENVVIVQE